MVCFVNTHPMDSDLFGGYRYPPFEQPGPGHLHQDYKGYFERVRSVIVKRFLSLFVVVDVLNN